VTAWQDEFETQVQTHLTRDYRSLKGRPVHVNLYRTRLVFINTLHFVNLSTCVRGALRQKGRAGPRAMS
jgi:hypothetical protein